MKHRTTGKTKAIGFDGYNASLTGDRVATLGVNCGMSTGRQGVIVEETDDLHIPKDKETTIRDGL